MDWTNPGSGNEPQDYWKHIERSEFLHKFIDGVIPKDLEIIELGCNCGRNVAYLNSKGYKTFGFDINPKAIEFKKDLPIWHQSIEDYFSKDVEVDMYFSMAVLEHIKSDWVFKKMKAAYILTIEDEITDGGAFHKRNYKEIFESLGYRQIKHETNREFFITPYEVRLFINDSLIRRRKISTEH